MTDTGADFSASLLDPIVQSDPYDLYQVLHTRCPVYRMPETGFYLITKHSDLRRVLTEPKVFSNAVNIRQHLQGGEREALHQRLLEEGGGWRWTPVLQLTDPPEHTRYRRLVNRVFTPKRVREMSTHIERAANSLIDAFIDRGACDFVEEFAEPLPGMVICEQHGLRSDQLPMYRRWTDAMLRSSNAVLTDDQMRASVEQELESQRYIADLISDRRAQPRNDLVSALVHAHEGTDERELSMPELQSMMRLLIIGGFHTTTGALGSGMRLLLQHPNKTADLRAEPSMLKAFIEEVLRVDSPVQGMARITTEQVEIGGTTIPKDSVVIARYGAANRDNEQFDDAARFDVDRPNLSAHLAFGLGAHYCVGASLARAEIEVSLRALLDRLDNLELAGELAEPIHQANFGLMLLKTLPIRFSRREDA